VGSRGSQSGSCSVSEKKSVELLRLLIRKGGVMFLLVTCGEEGGGKVSWPVNGGGNGKGCVKMASTSSGELEVLRTNILGSRK